MTSRPASKKIGKPNSSEASESASGARFSPKIRSIVEASTSAPPDCSRIRPNTAPKPMIRASLPTVEENESTSRSSRPVIEVPATRAVPAETTIRETVALSLSHMISTSRIAMDPAPISSRVVGVISRRIRTVGAAMEPPGDGDGPSRRGLTITALWSAGGSTELSLGHDEVYVKTNGSARRRDLTGPSLDGCLQRRTANSTRVDVMT